MKKWCIILIFSGLMVSLSALDMSAWNKAFIFNVPSILLEIKEYQGGLGFKTGPGSWFVRSMIDFLLEDDDLPPAVFLLGLGLTFESHPVSGKASPYWGGTVGVVYSSARTDIAGGDWSQEETLKLDLGPVLGIELKLLEGVTLFAEYQLKGSLGWPAVTTFTGGQTERISGDLQWSVDLALGNTGLIGLCIYW